ncbi:hypothetical protein COT77_01170 [Candidatus Berkelbacteria bacterium CG10_big_fil_rev_8_21_14_0_10_41_12]|uniref:PRC-barrel domain-containing protein n=1 Tax=Candidatus Berkelbacteria bacterium CG10_big_fil_rev_8_21_14_0_10_41_12 TaxID=1974513 RepID=A0A2M6WXI9_9BACT|nr:MAG: hypothetical protein COT77_01170 [Candidatus Berkelbacteria bacterium CG10_big_fil_rev_8_21_14_0_10_41_12]
MIFTKDILSKPVYSKLDHPIGKVVDLSIAIYERCPKILGFLIEFSQIKYIDRKELIEPARNIRLMVGAKFVKLLSGKFKLTQKEEFLPVQYLHKKEILINKNIIDQTILNLKKEAIGRVNDVVIFEEDGYLKLYGISVGIVGLVSKLGLEIPIELLDKGLGKSFLESVISWKYVKEYRLQKGEIVINSINPMQTEEKISWNQIRSKKKKSKLKKPLIANLIKFIHIGRRKNGK